MSNTIQPYQPDGEAWSVIQQQAITIAKSGLAPSSLRSPDAIAVVALKGSELGIPPMMALNHIHVIQGKPTVSAELMRALILRAGHMFRIVEADNDKAIVEGQRFNRILDDYEETARAQFTMEDAKRAGITGKDNWRKYPRAMLVARATAILAREQFADVLMGASYIDDEVEPVEGRIEVHSTEREVPDEVLVNPRSEAPEPPAPALPTGEPPAAGTSDDSGPSGPMDEAPTKAQFAKFHAILHEYDVTEVQYRSALDNIYGVKSVKDLNRSQLSLLIDRISEPEGMSAFMEHIDTELISTEED